MQFPLCFLKGQFLWSVTPKRLCQYILIYYRAMLASLSPPPLGDMSILNVANSSNGTHNCKLPSRSVRCELWFPSNPYFLAPSSTVPKVHWKGHLPKSGVPGFSCHSCHTQSLLWLKSPPVMSWLLFLLVQNFSRDVCALWSKRKRMRN